MARRHCGWFLPRLGWLLVLVGVATGCVLGLGICSEDGGFAAGAVVGEIELRDRWVGAARGVFRGVGGYLGGGWILDGLKPL